MTFDQITQVWLNNRSPRTIRNYTHSLVRADRIAKDLFKKSFINLTYPELILFMNYERVRQSPHSQCTMTYIFKSFFRTVQKLGIRKDNPAEELTAPKYQDTLADRIIDHEAIERIIAAARTDRDRLMYKTLYMAGLRVCELVGLKCNDLMIQQRGGKPTFTLRIWGKGQRTDYVQVPEEFGQELHEYVRMCHPLAFMFNHSGGKGFTTQGVRDNMRLAAAAAGYPKVTPHFFRHAHATQALQNGASLVAVQRSLRHKSIQTTTKYIHLNPEEGAGSFLPKINPPTT
jgi:integrase/recombinase XerD